MGEWGTLLVYEPAGVRKGKTQAGGPCTLDKPERKHKTHFQSPCMHQDKRKSKRKAMI